MFVDSFPEKKNWQSSATTNGRVLALMYHSISEACLPAPPWIVTVEKFKRQLALLQKQQWNPICAKDVQSSATLHTQSILITFDDGYVDNFENALPLLREFGLCATFFVVAGDIGKQPSWSDADMPSLPIMNRQQLLELSSSGMEIGAHTQTHRRLRRLNDTELAAELIESKKTLEDVIGKEVVSFAYPYGELDERIQTAVKKAGFKVAFTTASGWAFKDQNPLSIRRLTVAGGGSLTMFKRNLIFADNEMNWSKTSQYYLKRIRSRVAGTSPKA